MHKEFYGTAEVAEILGMNRMQLNRIIRKGHLSAVAVGSGNQRRVYVIPRKALLEFLGEID